MKHLTKIRILTAILAIAAFAVPVVAQSQFDYLTATLVQGKPASVVVTAVSSNTALLIRYVGAQVSGTVDVSAAGLITFKHGAAAAEVVDTSVECDGSIAVTGSRNGIWDVSNAACNTISEGAGVINGQRTSGGVQNWIIVPLDALGSDDLNWAGSGGLVTVSAQSASSLNGYAAKWDTAVTFTDTIALLPPEARVMSYYTTGTIPTKIYLKPGNPFQYQKTILGSANATSTFGSGTSLYAIHQVLPNYVASTAFGETVTTLYPSTAGGATTVLKAFIALSDSTRIFTAEGQKLVGRLTNSAAMSAIAHNMYGVYYPGRVAERQ